MEENAVDLLISIIGDAKRHDNYKRVVEVAHTAKIIFAETSEQQREVLKGLRHAETPEQLETRLRITNPITAPALAGPISYQAKIARTPDKFMEFTHPDADAVQAINENFERYYAGQDLYGYLFDQCAFANNCDPGAWLIFEQVQTPEEQRVYCVKITEKQAV